MIKKIISCPPIVWIIIYTSLTSFAGAKSMISLIHPYGLDATLSTIDQTLHFGFHAYEILNVTAWPSNLLWFVDEAYMLWFMIMYAWLINAIAQCNIIDMQKRIIAFLLSWYIIGIFVATLFSSVGPIFWNDYYNTPNPYQPLIDYLQYQNQTLDMHVFMFYDMLRQFQTNETLVDLNAPSAMPSMHIGIACLMMITTRAKWIKGAYVPF
jgi:hypothetical protein